MIDHMSLPVADLAASRAFYVEALAPLGFGVVMEFPGAVAFGPAGRPILWLSPGGPVSPGLHLAFTAADRAGVDAFYAAALAAGGKDNGGPGLRTQYHPNYYGAFVFDLDGNNVEAVCHRP